MVKIIHLNTLLDIMIMILSEHYFVKFPQMTSYINKFKDKKTKITTSTKSLMVKDKQLFKNYNKIW